MLGGSPAISTEINTSTDDDQVLIKATGQRRSKNKKSKIKNSRRFSDEQIKSLESLFKMENKLEPKKKLEMARELGLHPRQVAIWFQNRRARWKSKQVEQDYTSLKADYDTLTHRFDSLNKEKHDLLQQLRDVCNQLKEGHEAAGSKDLEMSGSENGDTNLELNNGNNSSSGFSGPLEQDMAICNSDEDDHPNQLKQELENVMKVGDQVLKEAHENVSNFDLGSLFDHSCGPYSNLWDF